MTIVVYSIALAWRWCCAHMPNVETHPNDEMVSVLGLFCEIYNVSFWKPRVSDRTIIAAFPYLDCYYLLLLVCHFSISVIELQLRANRFCRVKLSGLRALNRTLETYSTTITRLPISVGDSTLPRLSLWPVVVTDKLVNHGLFLELSVSMTLICRI